MATRRPPRTPSTPPTGTKRLLFRVDDGLYELVDADAVFHCEADDDDTLVRTRRKRPYRSTERLTELLARLPSPPFFRVHRSHVVNLDRVRRVRQRDTRGWEVVLDPPVGTIVPVARGSVDELFRLLGRKQ